MLRKRHARHGERLTRARYGKYTGRSKRRSHQRAGDPVREKQWAEIPRWVIVWPLELSPKLRLERIIRGEMHGIHYAVSIFFATAVLWVLVHEMAKANPVWAISSMVATSDPQLKTAVLTFRARIINTIVGCAIGLAFIAIGGTRLVSSTARHGGCGAGYLVRGPHSNHVAPGADFRGFRDRRRTGISLPASRPSGRCATND